MIFIGLLFFQLGWSQSISNMTIDYSGCTTAVLTSEVNLQGSSAYTFFWAAIIEGSDVSIVNKNCILFWNITGGILEVSCVALDRSPLDGLLW